MNIKLYVYSSGSIHAQKLLFGHTAYGDLNHLFSGYYDTTLGHKREATSYQKIVDDLGLPAQRILFLSDIVEELDAAQTAGMKTRWLVRMDNPMSMASSHLIAHSFAEIDPELA
jgi:enolase-phosphatase E1